MASAISHAFVAVALGTMYARDRMPKRFWVLSVLCAVLPDADVIGLAWGIRYDSLWGHRGLTHALSFALLLSLGVVSLAMRAHVSGWRQWCGCVGYFFVVTASHGVLDALTNGGHGIAFLAPVETTRYFFPWRPVMVSPISIRAFLSTWGLQILVTELLYLWLPMIVGCIVVLGWRHRHALHALRTRASA